MTRVGIAVFQRVAGDELADRQAQERVRGENVGRQLAAGATEEEHAPHAGEQPEPAGRRIGPRCRSLAKQIRQKYAAEQDRPRQQPADEDRRVVPDRLQMIERLQEPHDVVLPEEVPEELRLARDRSRRTTAHSPRTRWRRKSAVPAEPASGQRAPCGHASSYASAHQIRKRPQRHEQQHFRDRPFGQEAEPGREPRPRATSRASSARFAPPRSRTAPRP